MVNTKVSIGMPVYNSEKWVAATIESLLSQTYENTEIVISDNCSTDSSGSIISDYARMDKRIKYHRNDRNIGVNGNYNLVFQKSTGTYFKWASSNDLCHPQYIEKCVDILDSNADVVLCYPKTFLLFENDSLEEYEDNLNLTEECACMRLRHVLNKVGLNNAMNGLIRRDALAQTRLHLPYLGSDLNLLVELALLGKLFELPDRMFFRRMDGESATKYMSRDQQEAYFFPEKTRKPTFQFWRQTIGYFSSVMRNKMPADQKLCAISYLMKFSFWNKARLINDLPIFARFVRKG